MKTSVSDDGIVSCEVSGFEITTLLSTSTLPIIDARPPSPGVFSQEERKIMIERSGRYTL